jgi:hypothetical protein
MPGSGPIHDVCGPAGPLTLEAFDHLDGIAEECKYDGQKTVVLRWEGPQPRTPSGLLA